MPTEETYEEYLDNFRKTYSKYPQTQPMSREQFEAAKATAKMKAAEEAAKIKAAEEAGTTGWWEQEGGPADKIIEKYGTTSADIAKQSIPYQRGQSKGNQGDNVDNPDKLNTAEITKLQHEAKKLSGPKDSYTPEEIEAAKNSAGITKEVPGSTSAGSISATENANKAITGSVTEVVTPKEDDPPEVVENKNQYNKAMMSIWDAYRNGDISKETAGYFTIDAIATLAKNLGRSIGNVGAQFSGGTIDNGHDESKWGQRQNALLKEEIGKETESLGGKAGRQAESEKFDNILKSYQTNKAATVNDMLKDFRAKANDPSLPETEKRFYQVCAAQIAGAGLDGNTQIASIGVGVWDDIKSKVDEWLDKRKKKKDKEKDKKKDKK